MAVVNEFLHFVAVLFTGVFFTSANALPTFVPVHHHKSAVPHVSVLFGGDMMFDRSIRLATEKKGGDFVFSCLDPVLKDADLVVANLEGPITNNASKSMGTAPGSDGNFTFTFPLKTAELLYAHNVRLVNLGNNHILNFGVAGATSTMAALDAAQVGYFGDPLEYGTAEKDFGDIRLAFINYNEFGGRASTTIQQIQDARAAGRLPVVYTHWGIEYELKSPEYVQKLAHRFVDAGAEIVIGSHPHVVEEREFYMPTSTEPVVGSEKYIYYSLGNLIFDQYWNSDVRRGLMLRVDFTAKGVRYLEEVPVELQRDRRTCVIQ